MGELREAADLGRQCAGELIVVELQNHELRVLEELGRQRAIEALVAEVKIDGGEGSAANRGRVRTYADRKRAAPAGEDDERDGARLRRKHELGTVCCVALPKAYPDTVPRPVRQVSSSTTSFNQVLRWPTGDRHSRTMPFSPRLTVHTK